MNYRFGDLILASEFPCSQLPPGENAAPDCMFALRRGPEPPNLRWHHAWPAAGGGVALRGARDGDAYTLGAPGVAVFSIDRDASRIVGRSVAAPETVEHLLIDQVLPRVLAHKGRLVLHAGGVRTPFGAIAFLGESGAGKSTLCSALARAGHPVLGDDGLVVRDDGGGMEVFATYPGLRLLPPSLRHFYGTGERTSPVASDRPKRRVAIRAVAGPLPLRAIYALAEHDAIDIAPIPGVEAIMALVKSSFHLHWGDAKRSRDHLERIAATVRAVPPRILRYPRDFAALPRVIAAVLEDLAARAA